MLPEDPADGLAILDLARELVVTFLQPAAAIEPARASVVALVRDRPDLPA
jgi:hypothetical protein